MRDPARILFVTIPERGHVNPLVGIAQRLEGAGHVLGYFAAADLTADLRRAGLRGPVFAPPPATAPADFVTKGRDFVERLRDRDWLRRWIARLLLDVVPAQLEAIGGAIAALRPDVVVADPMVYAAVLAAHEARIPWAGLSSSLNPVTPESWTSELGETVRELAPARAALFAARGLEPRFRVCDAISPWLNTVFTTAEYVPRSLSGNDFSIHVGPTAPLGPRGDELPFPWERAPADRPLVYFSLGSQLFHHPELFAAAAAALVPEGITLAVSAGDLADDPLFRARLPPEVIVVRYAPQLALLDRASLLISHGGANSVMECLHRGKPLLLVPICNDQPLQARFLAAAGAGRVLEPGAFDVASCRAAVRALLEPDAPERRRAAEIGRAYAASDGAAETARRIVELARTGEPQRP